MTEIKTTVSERIFEDIKHLTELELLELMELLPEYLRREKMTHIVDQVFEPAEDLEHEIDELNSKIEELEDEISDHEETISRLDKRAAEAIEKCEAAITINASDSEITILNNIIEILQD